MAEFKSVFSFIPGGMIPNDPNVEAMYYAANGTSFAAPIAAAVAANIIANTDDGENSHKKTIILVAPPPKSW